MHAVVVYESMFGNTHLVADAIGQGIAAAVGDGAAVTVVPVGEADRALLADADLVVVGGPTHAHGMSHASTREAAVEQAHKEGSDVELDPDAEGPGLRDWFAGLGDLGGAAAAFDTRMDVPAVVSGRASRGISRKLRHHGFDECAEPMSFLVTKQNHLEPGEEEHARRWGASLVQSVAP